MSRLAPALVVVVLTVAACGGDGGDGSGADADRFELTTPRQVAPAEGSGEAAPKATSAQRRPVTRAEARVIKAWSDALRRGRVARAVAYFRIPSRVSDGRAPIELTSRSDVRLFNESLPCGARLEKTRRAGGTFVLATFVLTERPGPGSCGDGTGKRARTLFDIQDGRIVQWIRATDP
jgi:hypothetical protein